MPIADMVVIVSAVIASPIPVSIPTEVITPRAVPPNNVTSQQSEPHFDNGWLARFDGLELGHY